MQNGQIAHSLEQLYPKMVQWRRHLHQFPELSFHESATAAWIAERLVAMGCEVVRDVGGNGVVAVIRGTEPGPVVALRADIDALPIQDEKTCEYTSKVAGVMHACGHDAHTATLLAVADHYSRHRHAFRGERRLLFQPAEEVTPGGAIGMIEDGALGGAEAIYGVHLWTPLPYGQAASRAGAFMSAADEFTIDIWGKGGHGGLPHEAVDAIFIGSAFVQAVQSIVSRSVNPVQPAVVTVGSFHAGTANNVIAESCQLKGTIRSFDEEERRRIHKLLEKLLEHTCEMYGATCQLDLRLGYPPVVNEQAEAARFFKVAAELFGRDRAIASEPITVAEDFAYYLQRLPGCFMFVGAGNPDTGANYAHHHPRFDIDERAMVRSARLLIAMAEDFAVFGR
ncbi:amidohydrolase [Paenibacillus sp. J5C_2022]|uniref:amidohydrolase n=1 Tax=Paenibacillus sp. J5C2022 TaxID=2977129 RepID=UPI0021CF72A0|nr:amidohydrolase [Paenibacillus sp. J5C2022]MCU6708974.1 amidohydrolase [Paenibacillus sp. J5C2022]